MYGGPFPGSYINILQDGTATIAAGFSGDILYGSYGLMNRICIPNANVFTNAFKDIVTSFYNASNSGTFGNFISDLTNVN